MRKRIINGLIIVMTLSIMISCSTSPTAKIQGVFEVDKESLKSSLQSEMEGENAFAMGLLNVALENAVIEFCIKGDSIKGILFMAGETTLLDSKIVERNDSLIISAPDFEAQIVPTETGLKYSAIGSDMTLKLNKTDRTDLSSDTKKAIEAQKVAIKEKEECEQNLGKWQDLLDNVKSNSKIVTELKDVFRASKINLKITEQKEIINLFLHDGSEKELNAQLDNFIKDCNTFKQIQFNDGTLNSFVSNYVSLTIQSYQIAKSKGFSSNEFKKDFEKYKKEKEKYMNYLMTTYSTAHFVSMTEEKYWQTVDKNNYIKSSEYGTYKNLKTTNLKDALALLDKISKQTTDFQEHLIYEVELADQYVKHANSLDDYSSEIPIGKYKALLEQKKYSIYLFETWRKWRVVTQQNMGLSKSSDIPNDEYDKVREQVALVILEYITKNESDEMAINQFTLMATHDIVRRFGAFPYGNQNIVEYHELFDDKK